jgi:threonylcarbamoyladenosine tRNA methylthiotransferase CDKAL1
LARASIVAIEGAIFFACFGDYFIKKDRFKMRPNVRQKIFFSTTFKLCDNNGYLSTQIHNFFLQDGFKMVADPERADSIVISTCGFDQERENFSISIVDQYIEKYSSGKRIIVCGCLPKISPDLFDPSQVVLIGPKELHRFNEIFKPAVKIEDVSGSNLDEHYISREYGFSDAYYLQICQGCVNNCSYCGIKKAKGHVTSKPIDKILCELEKGIGMGFQRVMLLADDCGSYGVDLGVDFADLLNQLTDYDIRIHINYIEPREFQLLYSKINPEVFEKIDFMNIPVQATSKRIIGLMNRHYDVADIMALAREVKDKYPHIFIETHVIYGFPGETREEFKDTFRLAEVFDSIIYFYYTDRNNVKSSLLPGKLSCHEIIHRTREVMRHPEYCQEQEAAAASMVLLGYGLSAPDLFKSIERNCACQGNCAPSDMAHKLAV